MKESTDVTRTEEIRARVGEISNQNRYYVLLKMDIQYLLTELQALREENERLKGALELIKDRFDSADKAAGNEAFDERRSGLAWVMWTDAKAALSPSPAQEQQK